MLEPQRGRPLGRWGWQPPAAWPAPPGTGEQEGLPGLAWSVQGPGQDTGRGGRQGGDRTPRPREGRQPGAKGARGNAACSAFPGLGQGGLGGGEH